MNTITENKPYCHSLTEYERWETREVNIGTVPLGGENPIRVQSMTTTDTMDTIGTVEQSIRIIEAGADYVRITAPSMNEARNLENIRKELRARGYETPLIADIHFTPNAAELAARIVEKVRVNPGNYADKKKFAVIEYTDASYEVELERIREVFLPLFAVVHFGNFQLILPHGSNPSNNGLLLVRDGCNNICNGWQPKRQRLTFHVDSVSKAIS